MLEWLDAGLVIGVFWLVVAIGLGYLALRLLQLLLSIARLPTLAGGSTVTATATGRVPGPTGLLQPGRVLAVVNRQFLVVSGSLRTSTAEVTCLCADVLGMYVAEQSGLRISLDDGRSYEFRAVTGSEARGLIRAVEKCRQADPAPSADRAIH